MTKAAPTVPNSPSFFVVMIAGTITVFFVVAIIREFLQSQDLHRQLSRLKSDVTTEQQHQRELQDLLTYLSSPIFQERQARLELGLKADGERVVVVPDTAVDPEAVLNQAGESLATEPNPVKWWHYFFASKKTLQ